MRAEDDDPRTWSTEETIALREDVPMHIEGRVTVYRVDNGWIVFDDDVRTALIEAQDGQEAVEWPRALTAVTDFIGPCEMKGGFVAQEERARIERETRVKERMKIVAWLRGKATGLADRIEAGECDEP